MPEDMSIEFLKESLGSADPFMKMIEYCDSVMSIAIVGQTLSGKATNTGLGSGVAMLQGNVRQDLLESDANQLSDTITRQLISPLMTLNDWDKGRAFKYFFDTSTTEDLAVFAGAIKSFVSSGLELPVDWIYAKSGIPAPEPDDKVIGGVSAPTSIPVNTPTHAPVQAAMSTLKPSVVTTKSYIDTCAPKLMTDMSPVMDSMLSKVRTLIKESSSLADFKAKLVKFFPESDAMDLASLLAKAFAASELAGMYAIKTQKAP